MIVAFGRSRPDLGDFEPPTLERLPEAVVGNVRSPGARTRARIMAVVKADAYGHGSCTVALAAVAAGAEWLGTTDVAEVSELRATGLTGQIPHSTTQDGLESAPVHPSRGSSGLGAREVGETLTHGRARPMAGCIGL